MKKLLVIFAALTICNCSFSQGSAWVEQTLPAPLHRLNCIGAFTSVYTVSSGWIGGDSGTVYYTSDNGANWLYRPCTQAGAYRINTIDAVNSTTAICSYNSATAAYILRSTNGGLNWQQVYQQNGGYICSFLMWHNNGSAYDSIGYAIGNPVGGRWTILKTTNQGVSFDSAGMYLHQLGNETSFINALSLYQFYPMYLIFGTDSGRVYRSINGGTNWSAIVLPFMNVVTPAFYSGVHGLSGFAAGGSLAAQSTDQGVTWQTVTLPGSGNINAFNRTVNWGPRYCRSSNIYYSTNDGLSFTLEYTSPNGGVYTDISIRSSVFEGGFAMGWAVKDNGTVSRYFISFGGIQKIRSEIPGDFSLSQNYPNPFNPGTKIKFQIAHPLNLPLTGGDVPAVAGSVGVKLIIYDALGREVATLVNENLQPGTYETEWDASNYPSGVYFYQLTVQPSDRLERSDGYVQTKKMVLLK